MHAEKIAEVVLLHALKIIFLAIKKGIQVSVISDNYLFLCVTKRIYYKVIPVKIQMLLLKDNEELRQTF